MTQVQIIEPPAIEVTVQPDGTTIDAEVVEITQEITIEEVRGLKGEDGGSAGLTLHIADTTDVHGIPDTGLLVDTNDARLANARTPTAHAATHEVGGSDEVVVDASQLTGVVLDLHLPASITRDTELATAVATEVFDRNAAIATAINNLYNLVVNGAPGTLDAFNEIATALANDPNFATTITTALAGKQPLNADLTAIQGAGNGIPERTSAGVYVARSYAQIKTSLALVKGDVGLANADNTSDANKPVSTAQQTALDGKQPLDTDLTAIALLTTTAFGRSFLDRADAAAGRTLLGLGTASTRDVATSGDAAAAQVVKGDDTRLAPVIPDAIGAGTHYYMIPGMYSSNSATTNAVVGRVVYEHFRLTHTTRFDRIAIDVTGALAGASIRLGLTAVDESGQAVGAALASVDVDAATTGFKEGTIDVTLPAGNYARVFKASSILGMRHFNILGEGVGAILNAAGGSVARERWGSEAFGTGFGTPVAPWDSAVVGITNPYHRTMLRASDVSP